MKVKITEEKLYPIFKKFMETQFKRYEWRRDKNNGGIFFMDPEGYGQMELVEGRYLHVYADISEGILRYIPMEQSMLESLMSRWVGETFQIEGLIVQVMT